MNTPTPSLKSSTSLTTPSTETSVDKIPGPTRLILVDSKLFPGAIAEIPLDGNCLITGTNAAGKTSIIQLPTLFYGVSPSKISDKQQGKSFYGHYLPNTTSYVAFEYRHRDGHARTVIIHSASGEEKPMFRFVRSALYEDMFITDDGGFVESPHLASHLRNRGYDVAEKIIDTLADYRTIIHGLPVKGKGNKDQSFLKQMVARFTVSQYQHPLHSVDDVVFSMLKRDASLQKLEDMIAHKILGDDRELDIDADKSGLESWPAQYEAYQAVMAVEDKARKLDVKCVEMEGYETERVTAISELLALRKQLTAEQTQATEDEEKHKKDLKDAEEASSQAKSDIADEVSEAQTAQVSITNEIDSIEAQESESLATGILNKVALSDKKASIKDARDETAARHAALVGDKDGLSKKYDDLKQAARDSSAAEIEGIRADIEAARQANDEALDAAKERHALAEAAAAEAHAEAIALAEAALEEANGELGAAKEALKNPAAPQEVIDKRDAAQAASTKAAEAYSKSLKDAEVLRKALEVATKAHNKVEAEIDAHKRKIESLEQSKEKLKQSKKPPAGSLLAHLRDQHEGWGENIAKIIDPDLLFRTDLAPRQVEDSGSLFGLEVDLESIPVPDIVDLAQIDAEIAECDVEIAEQTAMLDNAGNRMVQTLRARNDANADLTRHLGAESGLERAAESAKDTLKTCADELKEAREQAAELAKERVSDAQADCISARDKKKEAIEARKADVSAVKQTHAVEISSLKSSHTTALSEHNARIKTSRDDLKERLTTLDDELAAAMEEKGIDPKLIKELQTEIDAHNKDLTSIRTNTAIVDAWRAFKKNRLPLLPALRTELAAADKELNAKKAKQTALRQKWRDQKVAFDTKITNARSIIDAKGVDLKKISRRFVDVDLTDIAPAVTTTRSLDDLIVQLNRSETSTSKLKAEIRAGVIEVARVFEAVKESPAEQYLRSHKAEFTTTVEGPEWVPAFIEWFNTRHLSQRDTLMQNGRQIANKIKGRFQRLTSLDRRIATQNRKLQESIDENNVLSVVQELSVGITSSIRKLEFMPAMEKLSVLHEAWMKSTSILPPEGFSDAMADLLQHWTGKNAMSTDLRDHIRIEGYIIENMNKRSFHARTDMKNLSSNGISYLVLTIILASFVNMVRGKAPLHMVWALDELGDLDPINTRKLLDMLRGNNITLLSATPQATAEVNKLFDYRIKVIAGPKLADIRNAGRCSQRLLPSPAAEAAGQKAEQPQPANQNEAAIAGAA